MTFKNICAVAISACVIHLSAGPASAQSPAPPVADPTVPWIDLSVGYQHVKYGFPSRNEPRGFYLDASLNARNGLGLVVNSGASFSRFDFQTETNTYHDRVTLGLSRIGVRYGRRLLRTTLFAQTLIGTRDYVVRRTTTNRRTNTSTSGSSSRGADRIGTIGAGATLQCNARCGAVLWRTCMRRCCLVECLPVLC